MDGTKVVEKVAGTTAIVVATQIEINILQLELNTITQLNRLSLVVGRIRSIVTSVGGILLITCYKYGFVI